MTKVQLMEAVAELHALKVEIAEASGSTLLDVKEAIERECRRWTFDPTPIDLLEAARTLYARLYGWKRNNGRGE